ncbi:MAG: DUF1638 domain-containing protein [Bacillota bacterium]|nr:DUF1638 domain-containing protein [Bacillota bacterium]
MKRYMMLACELIEDEVHAIMERHELNYPILFLPPDLHLLPKKLNEYLQDIINRIQNVDYLILPMGRCGNGTLGLKSDHATLILPKCEDCVNLLLSKDSLKVNRPKYSMFFTDGWLRNGASANHEYERVVEQYGQERANMVMEMMYAGYKYFSLIDTGAYDKDMARKKLAPLVDTLGTIEVNELPGPYGILEKMLTLDFDEENFVMIPPGVAVTEQHFES